MEQLENYQKEKLTINLVWANVFGLIIIAPIGLIYGLPWYLIWGNRKIRYIFENLLFDESPQNSGIKGLTIFLIVIVGIILHEFIHGLSWAMYAKKGFKSMKFGVLWSMLTPYCHCKEPLKVKHYIIGALTPAIFLGLIPAIVSIIFGYLDLLLFGIFFTIAAGGDFLIINLLKKENMNDLVQDHPSEAGCYIYRKINDE